MHKFLFCLILSACALPCFAQTTRGQRLPETNIHQDVSSLITLLNSPDALDKVKALNALGRLKDKAVPAIPQLAALLGDTSDPVSNYIGSGMPTRVSERASDILRIIGAPALSALVSALQNGSEQARVNASRALVSLSQLNLDQGMSGLDLDLWPVILNALQDKDEFISHNAASISLSWHQRRYLALISLRPLAAEQTLIVSLALPVEPFLKVSYDKRPFVRQTILKFLPAIADGRPRPHLRGA